jgi:hypothetical protein
MDHVPAENDLTNGLFVVDGALMRTARCAIVLVLALIACNEPDLYIPPGPGQDEPPSGIDAPQAPVPSTPGRASIDAISVPDGAIEAPLPGDSSTPLGPGKDNGASCSAASECASGHCVEGLCCDSACEGPCMTCRSASSPGSCVATAEGQTPAPGRPACERGEPSTCLGTGACDGRGLCAFHPPTTVCAPASCKDGLVREEGKCSGAGQCVLPSARSCKPFRCDAKGVSCASACTSNADCDGEACVNGRCGRVGIGIKCSAGSDCLSGHCRDGVCCDRACGEPCEACDLPDKLGTCSNLPAGQQPHGKPRCPGSGTCAAACSGTSNQCSYPTSQCRAGSCSGNTAVAAVSCDGKGSCPESPRQSCGDMVCRSSRCEKCTDDKSCGSGRRCCSLGQCAECCVDRDCKQDEGHQDSCESGRCQSRCQGAFRSCPGNVCVPPDQCCSGYLPCKTPSGDVACHADNGARCVLLHRQTDLAEGEVNPIVSPSDFECTDSTLQLRAGVRLRERKVGRCTLEECSKMLTIDDFECTPQGVSRKRYISCFEVAIKDGSPQATLIGHTAGGPADGTARLTCPQ